MEELERCNFMPWFWVSEGKGAEGMGEGVGRFSDWAFPAEEEKGFNTDSK